MGYKISVTPHEFVPYQAFASPALFSYSVVQCPHFYIVAVNEW